MCVEAGRVLGQGGRRWAGARNSRLEILNSRCLLDIQVETNPELGVIQTGD